MKKIIKIELFKNVVISIDDNEVILSKQIGKKLINLFEFLALNANRTVSNEEIKDALWPESVDARDVIKYSVFRLRKELSEIDFLSDINLIVTNEDGYRLSREYEYDVDTIKLEEIYRKYVNVQELTAADYKKVSQVIDLYKGRFFLSNNPPLALTLQAEEYSLYYSSLIIMASKYLMSKRRFEEMMKMNYNAIVIEPFYEGLHYYYIKGLIEVKDYHSALEYYDEIHEKFVSELGIGLSPQFSELYDEIKNENAEVDSGKKNIKMVMDEIEHNFKPKGGFYCNYDMFRHMYEITTKNAKRDGKKCFLILFTVDKTANDVESVVVSNQLKKYIEESIRTTDVFAKINNNQFIVLVSCNDIDNLFIIISRITPKFYKKYGGNKYRLNYDVKEIDDDND